MSRSKPVDIPTAHIFLSPRCADFLVAPHVDASSRRASLDPRRWTRKISPSLASTHIASVTVHRFEETIGGRAYHIEVRAVSNRWRAQLRRTPGVPTAMMPFYGATPDEAARHLAQWLTLAHSRRAAIPSS
jgi:hypothetical protein